jgi:hypothetical protein
MKKLVVLAVLALCSLGLFAQASTASTISVQQSAANTGAFPPVR